MMEPKDWMYKASIHYKMRFATMIPHMMDKYCTMRVASTHVS